MMEAADDAGGNAPGPELEEDEEFMNQPFTADHEARILALCQHSDKLGVAIYLEGENVIKVSSDLPSSHADMAYTLEGLKAGLNPSLILTTTNISNNSELLQLLVAPLTEGGEPYAHQVLKNACWDYASAVRSTCANLRVLELLQRGTTPGGGGGGGGRRLDGGMGADWSNDEARAFNLLSGVIDFNAEQSVRALGALISHLQSSVFSLEVDGSVPVLAVREMDLLAALRVDALSLRSLGIFCEEAHPNVLRGRGRSKEGFSVFALYDRTRSVPGRRCLREWFARPSTDLRVIHARQDGVELLMRPEHAELVRVIGAGLARGFDLPRLLLRVKRVTAVYRDWCRIVQSAEAAADVHDALAVLRRRTTHAPYAAFLDAVLSGISAPVMRRVARTLAGVIDVAASMEEKHLVLKHGLSPRLDTLRTTLGDLYNILHTVGGRIMHENPLLDDLTVEYVPQVGYLIALAGRNREFAPPTFQFAFAQGNTVFFKNDLMLKLDAELGDIYADIADCKAQVVRQLEDYLLSEEVDLQATAASLAELDAVLSLASAAVDLGLVRPAVVEDNVVVVKGGRHPLQELVVDAFIPNDTLLAAGGGHGTVALVTGANWSGKSVYIKQVGVLVFLAHVGSFLPCEKAIIGLTDRIFTRILTVESCSLPQSAFTIDMSQVAKMVRHATPRSLLLIDEFGKGTNAMDGAALLTALVRQLAGDGVRARCKALLTLHFLEVFRQGLVGLRDGQAGRTDLPGVSAFHMEVHVPESTGDGQDGGGDVDVVNDPVPLFRLVPGVTDTSYGFACARMGGLPEPVVQRAITVMRNAVGERAMAAVCANAGSSNAAAASSPFEIDADSDAAKAALRLLTQVHARGADAGDDGGGGGGGGSGWQGAPDEQIAELMRLVRAATRDGCLSMAA